MAISTTPTPQSIVPKNDITDLVARMRSNGSAGSVPPQQLQQIVAALLSDPRGIEGLTFSIDLPPGPNSENKYG